MDVGEMVGTIMFHRGRSLEYLGMRDNTFTATTATFGMVLSTLDLVVQIDDKLTISDELDQRRWNGKNIDIPVEMSP